MKISYQTKEESNRQQEQEFLALTPHERVLRFFDLMEQMKKFKTKFSENEGESNNFIIHLYRE